MSETKDDMDCEPCTDEAEFPSTAILAPSLIRARSYDEEGRTGEATGLDLHLSPINPLHASLDESQLLPSTTRRPVAAAALPRFRPTHSWEENNDPSVAPSQEEDGTRHAHFHFDLHDTMTEQTSTARKMPRHSSDHVLCNSKTPIRPTSLRGKKASTKRTPVSAKRHRAPLHQRRSPRVAQMTPQRSQQLFPPSSTVRTSHTPQEGAGDRVTRPMPGLLLDDTDITPLGLSAKRKKKSIGTVTTAASSHALETTTETEDSMDTNEHAPFRFTTFPASLPRVNHPLRTAAPGTIRKRMHFAESEAATVVTGHPHNRSRDDATHNSSVSSLPVEDGNMLYTDTEEEDNDDDDDAPYSHADPTRSPSGTPVARTRLNFNAAMSPTDGASSSSRRQTPLRMPDAPATPREVKMHFQMNAANCSPIRGIPEEDCEGSSGKSAGGLSRRNNLSHETTSSDTSSRPNRMRPLPDMEAFDDMNRSTTPTRERSGDDTSTTTKLSHPPSPKLLCPPTPVRTPAWAHADSSGSSSHHRGGKPGRMNRQNSLIATKVLAICSPQVLNERNSLENSLLEEEQNANNNSSSISDSTAGGEGGVGLSFDVETVVAQDSMDDSADWPAMGLRHSRPSLGEASDRTVTLSTSFDVLSLLGSGTFADVYKVRSKSDGRLYAVKKNRRQFRGKRDREKALAEVRYMQRLQSAVSPVNAKSSYSLYLLFFFRAWQEEGHFFCQTELCCRDTCRELLDSLRRDWRLSVTRYPSFRRIPCPPGVVPGSDADSLGRLTPESTVWKMCHDVCAGLSHIHSHGLAHFDIKPSNIFFIPHPRFGAMCKIGDFGMAGEIGTSEDGQEGDQKYMPLESLTNDARHPSADIFSLGLTLYELASKVDFEIPSDGQRWHDLRSGCTNDLGLAASRSLELVQLIQSMIQPDRNKRPTADDVIAIPQVSTAGQECDTFLRDYIHDIEEFDLREEQRTTVGNREQTPVIPGGRPRVWASPTFGTLPPMAPVFSPDAA